MSAPGQEMQPLKGAELGVTAIALALGTFMQVLDSTIANVSLPTISGNLGASTDQGTWIITSFAVSAGIAVPLTGWLMTRYGVVRTFVMAVLVFTLASFLCGIAWDLQSLIFFRVLQGAASGPMVPGSQALLIMIFPPHKRGTAIAIWSGTTLVAPVLGPMLGGWISDNMHWGWIFLINVPVGLASAFLVWNNLSKRETPVKKLPIDTVGLGLLVVWVGALQIMLDTGKNADWFASTQIVVLAIVTVVSFIAWLIWELTEEHPIVDIALFKRWNFALGTAAFCLCYSVFFANVVLLPLWLQTNVGYTATWAGLVAAPSGLVAIFMAPVTARLMAKYDPRWVATLAFTAFTASYFMRSGYTNDADFWTFTMPLLVQGIGMGSFFVSLLAISFDGVEPHRIPAASGISNFSRMTGGGFATAIVTTFWERREALHQSRLADISTEYNPWFQDAMRRLTDSGFTDLQAYGLLVRNLTRQAFLLSTLDLFYLSSWVTMALILCIWFAHRPKPVAGPPPAMD